MGLGLVTLAFLICFTIIYISKGLESKPEWLSNAAARLTGNIQLLAFWGLFYSVAAILLSPIMVESRGLMLVVFLSSIVLFLLTLPYMLDYLLGKYPDKVPAAVVNELKNAVGFVTSREKLAGYVGGGISFLLFLMLFR
jgi:hypothetical protein